MKKSFKILFSLILTLVFSLFIFGGNRKVKAEGTEVSLHLVQVVNSENNNVYQDFNGLYRTGFTCFDSSDVAVPLLSASLSMTGDNLYSKIKLNGKALSEAEQHLIYFVSQGLMYMYASADFFPATDGVYDFVVEEGCSFEFEGVTYKIAPFNLKYAYLYNPNLDIDGVFLNPNLILFENGGTPTVTCTGLVDAWSNVLNFSSKDIDRRNYEAYDQLPILVQFSGNMQTTGSYPNIGLTEDGTTLYSNMYNLKFSLGEYITLNGRPLSSYNRAIVNVQHGGPYLWIRLATEILVAEEGYPYPILEIKAGARVCDQILPNVKFIYNPDTMAFSSCYERKTEISVAKGATATKLSGNRITAFIQYSNPECGPVGDTRANIKVRKLGEEEYQTKQAIFFTKYETFDAYQLLVDGYLDETSPDGIYEFYIPKFTSTNAKNLFTNDLKFYILKTASYTMMLEEADLVKLNQNFYTDSLRITVSDVLKSAGLIEESSYSPDTNFAGQSVIEGLNAGPAKLRLSYKLIAGDPDAADINSCFFALRASNYYTGLRVATSSNRIGFWGTAFTDFCGNGFFYNIAYPKLEKGKTYNYDVYVYDELEGGEYKDTILSLFIDNECVFFVYLKANFDAESNAGSKDINSVCAILITNTALDDGNEFNGKVASSFHEVTFNGVKQIVEDGAYAVVPENPTPELECQVFTGWASNGVIFDAVKTPITGCLTLTPVFSHVFNQEVVDDIYLSQAATCTAEGVYFKSCVCGEKGTDTFTTDPLGHAPNEAVVENTVAPSCTQTGSHDEVVYCDRCKIELSRDTKTDAMVDHTPSAAVVENTVNPSCTVDGSHDEVVYCSECHTELSRENKVDIKLGHDLVDDEAVPATCTEAGSAAGKHCSRCDYTEGGDVIPALNHDLIDDEAVPATCTEAGTAAGKHCSRCDYTEGGETIPALNHDLIDDEAVPATCIEPGTAAGKHCSRCDYTEGGEVIPALGHDLVDDALVPATCTEPGTAAGKHCSRCDYTEGGEVIPATGHNLVDDAAIAATCTEAGKAAGKHCSNCDYTEGGEVIPATGHNLVDDEAIAATCTEAGKAAGKHCSNCDYTEGGEVIPALGHDLVDDPEIPATLEKEGKKAGKHCSRCDYTEGGEVIPKLDEPVKPAPQQNGCKGLVSAISALVISSIALVGFSIKRKENR